MSSPFNPYAEQHKDPKGPEDGRPTAFQVLEDNKLLQAWPDKVVLITGATSGIGIETTRAMYATGARVFILVRDITKAQPIVADIIKSTKGNGSIEIIEMDLDSLDSVKKAAQQFLQKSSKLHVLINNAGVMACPRTITIDGFERQFAVNYLAHFTLTTLLLPTMLSSSSPTFNSRVIWVSSSGHRHATGKPDLDDLGILDHYEPWAAYGQSKTAMIWASNYIDRTYGPRGVHSNAVHPGGILTNLSQYMTKEAIDAFTEDEEAMRQMKSVPQGAATQVWAASAPVWEGQGGKYLEDLKVAEPWLGAVSKIGDGYAAHAYDAVNEEKLWELSLELAKIENP
ncbi:putative short-chain dehydrogenase [Xylaria bambusicola]|uniref:putative short-chain dehydrogenase n=1 Tax=Xylaria bambusicola TaxID=326684 RepID=UPI002008A9D8|nr:putative short-chain dehydrogenase [Xylaria bambusicola]KAI0512971.1 putative short-chain dehydrogenase [Xylaria bambusicola]